MNFGFLFYIISRYYYLCFVLHNVPLNVQNKVLLQVQLLLDYLEINSRYY